MDRSASLIINTDNLYTAQLSRIMETEKCGALRRVGLI